MNKYKEAIGAKSVAALCFAQASETYHHWRVFAGGIDGDGVCIDFSKESLQNCFESEADVMEKNVRYVEISKLKLQTYR